MKIDNVLTKRLILVPMTFKMVCSVLDSRYERIEELGYKINCRWPRQDTLDILPMVEEGLRKSGETKGFDIWMIVKNENMAIIGDAGFKGGPDQNGEVEIGYGLIEEERRKGYGFEAVYALLSWAFSQDDVKIIKADCLIDNTGSIRILEKCGMRETTRDSELIYWEIERENWRSE